MTPDSTQQPNRRTILKAGAVSVASLGIAGRTTASSTVHVDPEDGSAKDTIQGGVDAVDSGGTVTVAQATYHEQVDIGKPVTIVGDRGDTSLGPGGAAPVLDGQDIRHHGFGIAEGTSGVTIRGFEITRYRLASGVGIGLTRQTTDVTLEHNYVHDIGSHGIHGATEQQGHDRLTVEANVVGQVPNGINLQNVSATRVVGNAVTGAGQGVVVAAAGEGDPVADVAVEANDLRDGDIGLRVGPGLDAGEVTATGNAIAGNDDFGALNSATGALTAERNWWGAPNGPEREAGRSGRTVGDGDRVSDGVDFTPWLPQKP